MSFDKGQAEARTDEHIYSRSLELDDAQQAVANVLAEQDPKVKRYHPSSQLEERVDQARG